MYIFLILLIVIALLGLSHNMYSLALFAATWVLSVLFVGYEGFNALSSSTVSYLYLMVLSITVGIIISRISYKKKCLHNIVTYHIKWHVVKLLLLFCLVIFTYFFVITIIHAGGINLNLIRTNNSADSVNSAFKGYLGTLLFFMIAQPLYTAIALILVYAFFFKNKFPKNIWTLFFLNGFLYLVTNAGRIFFIIIMSFFLSGYLAQIIGKTKLRINYKKVIICILGAFVLLNIMTKSRNSSTHESISFIQQAKQYIGCSIINMDYELKELGDINRFNCGYYAMGGFLYYPIKFYNIITGSKCKVPAEDLEYLQEVKQIEFDRKIIMYNALVPNAFYYYYDSGIWGIILFSFLAGLFIGKFETKVYMGDFFVYSLYSIGIYYLLFSPMGSQFWKTYMPMTIIWVKILLKISLCKKIKYL